MKLYQDKAMVDIIMQIIKPFQELKIRNSDLPEDEKKIVCNLSQTVRVKDSVSEARHHR